MKKIRVQGACIEGKPEMERKGQVQDMGFIFEAEHIKKTYRRRKKPVLTDVSLKAEGGQCVGILGANGCGKSTLLSILSGSISADGGNVRLRDFHEDGREVSMGRNRGQWVAYIPQENPLIEELTAKDNLRLWYADNPARLKTELHSGLLGILGIQEFLDVRVREMSGGMKKRVSIGCAMAKNPPVLLLDEPGAALDLPCKERISVYLKECLRQGKLIIIATHEEREIQMCDHLMILKDGTLQEISYDGDIHHLAGTLVQ